MVHSSWLLSPRPQGLCGGRGASGILGIAGAGGHFRAAKLQRITAFEIGQGLIAMRNSFPFHASWENAVRVLAMLLALQSLGACLLPPTAAQTPVRATQAPGFNPLTLPKLAIFVSEAGRRGRGTGVSRAIEDEFIGPLLQKGYQVVSRSDLDTLLGELRFQQRGVTEADVGKLGRMLNVPAILLVSVTGPEGYSTRQQTLDGRYINQRWARCTVGARLISVERAEVLWVAQDGGSFPADRVNDDAMLGYVARRVAWAFPNRQ